MRIQANPTVAATVPAATKKSSRTPHTPAMKATAGPAAAKPATVTSPARAAEVAAAPQTYGGAGSLLDAEA